jgi:hypothetical protein
MSIAKRHREILAYLSQIHVECEIEVAGSGHLRVKMKGPKGRRLVVASKTPSDGRGELNMFARFRRTARELGCSAA